MPPSKRDPSNPNAPVAASTVPVGATVQLAVSATVTSVGTTSVSATTTDGYVLGLDVNLPVVPVSVPLPATVESVVRASVNDGPPETLVLIPIQGQGKGNLTWYRVVVGSFVAPTDVLSNVQILDVRPAPSVNPPRPTVGPVGPA